MNKTLIALAVFLMGVLIIGCGSEVSQEEHDTVIVEQEKINKRLEDIEIILQDLSQQITELTEDGSPSFPITVPTRTPTPGPISIPETDIVINEELHIRDSMGILWITVKNKYSQSVDLGFDFVLYDSNGFAMGNKGFSVYFLGPGETWKGSRCLLTPDQEYSFGLNSAQVSSIQKPLETDDVIFLGEYPKTAISNHPETAIKNQTDRTIERLGVLVKYYGIEDDEEYCVKYEYENFHSILPGESYDLSTRFDAPVEFTDCAGYPISPNQNIYYYAYIYAIE